MEEHSYPRAIVHFDGDSFFASVEQAKDWRLRSKPVVTGGERGAATSLSIEAKRLGINRGMPIHEIRRRYPQAIIVAGDYTAYSLFARRMYAIAREFTPLVQEYSIDECFADITGLNVIQGVTYEAIAGAMKVRLQQSLGITFGVGLASSKTLAKVASKRDKPDGLTFLPREAIDAVLADTEIYDVWGLGGALSTRLRSLGVMSARDYVRKPDAWLKEHGFAKPARDTWLELQGHAISDVSLRQTFAHSVMKTRTFTPPSTDREYIFAQLSKNLEAACAKVRRDGMKARALSFYLKTQEFTYHGVQLDLPVPLDTPSRMLACIALRFDEVYAEGILYRASGVTLRSLVLNGYETPDLFGAHMEAAAKGSAFAALDSVNQKYGRDTIYLGSSMQARDVSVMRKKSLNIPYLGTVQ